jgi:hypothetical protein
MTGISVDPGRLGQEAGTLGSQSPPLAGAGSQLASAAATAAGALGSVSDDGLHAALQRLSQAWQYEVAAISSDLTSVSAVMNGLAQSYAAQDSQGAATINGG